ncbi:MAG: hypothetical protein HKN33_12020 [Pyrinomonadaceae bacterium]|nr:hypothetical protein [Pyrinomonadaceae bacterium]
MTKGVLYDFEGFRIDTAQKCLLRDEEIVPLTPKAFETLHMLVRNQGKVLTKTALLDEIWKDTFVEESTLAQNISTLRKTLSKYDPGTDFISTIPRRGYRFVADVTETAADEEILVVEKRSVTHIVAEQEKIDDKPNLTFVPRKVLVAVALALAALVASLFAASYYLTEPTQFDSKFKQFQMSTLFSGEDISNATVSPDGKYLAVLKSAPDGDVLVLRQINDGNEVKLVEGNDLNISGVVFAPQGDGVYYSAYKRSDPFPKIGNLYKVPLLGGASREIAKDVDGPVSFSPDASRFAFVRGKPDEMKSVLITANADGSNAKEIASRPLINGFSMTGLSWSPDGEKIAVTVNDRMDRECPMKLVAVNAETGDTKVLPGNKWIWIGKTAWLSDSSGVVVVAYRSGSPNLTDEAWFVSYPEGKVRPVTRGLSGITGVGVTDDGEIMIAGKNNRLTTRSYLHLESPEITNVISKSVSEDALFSLGARWMGDDKIVYSKTQNGNADIWMMHSDGTSDVQLTSEPAADFNPVISSDGRYIYFKSNRKGTTSIWRMRMDGTEQTEVEGVHYPSTPSFAAGSHAMYFSGVPEKVRFPVIMKKESGADKAVQVTDFRSFSPKVSPDGRFLLCFAIEGGLTDYESSKPLRLTLLSLEDNKIRKQYETVRGNELPLVEWKRDNKGFYFVDQKNGKNEILERDLDGETVRTIRKWDQGKIFQMAVSNDGKRLFVEKGEDVVSVLKFENTESG